jgi:hypothetical protein
MKTAEDSVPHCGTAEQGIAEEEALKKGMELLRLFLHHWNG